MTTTERRSSARSGKLERTMTGHKTVPLELVPR